MIKNNDYKISGELYTNREENLPSQVLFDNLSDLLRPKVVSDLLGVSVMTVYDWKYRSKTRKIPNDLFIKLNRLLFIRTEILRSWIISTNWR